MPNFYFEAVDNHNKIITGEKMATNEQEIAAFLKISNFTIVNIQNKDKSNGKITSKGLNISLGSGVGLGELANFTRNLSTMIRSGMPLAEAIGIIAEDTKSPQFKQILDDIKYDLESGRPLSVAMKKHPQAFDKIFTSLIAAGEMSGQMSEILDSLNKHIEKNVHLKNKLISAFTYPVVVLVAMVGMGLMMLILVVPKITDVFGRMNIKLPVALRILGFFSLVFVKFWFITWPVLILLLVILIMIYHSSYGKKIKSLFLQKVPLVSKLAKSYDMARMTSLLGLLMKSGVPVADSLHIVSDSVTNLEFRKVCLECEIQVKEGKPLSEVLGAYPKVVPNILIRITKVGEKSGKMDQVLMELGEYYDQQVDFQLKTMSDLIEPVLMLFVGAIVAALVLSIIAPIYGLVGNFSAK